MAIRKRTHVPVEAIILEISDISDGHQDVLLLIPGIRNSGFLGRQIKEVIYAHGSPVKPRRIHYGRYGLLRFLTEIILPCLRERNTINEISRKITDEIALANGRRVSVLCHSNATKLLAEVCRTRDYKFHRVILFASVCRERDIKALAEKCGRVVNVVARRDRVPILAEAIFPWRFARTGQSGSHEDWAEDIFYSYSHNDIFNNDVIKDIIVPIIMFSKIEYKFNVTGLSSLESPTTYRLVALFVAIAYLLIR